MKTQQPQKGEKSSVSFKETFYSFPQSHIPPKGENKCVRTHKEKNHITLQGNQNGGENLLLVINFQCKNP